MELKRISIFILLLMEVYILQGQQFPIQKLTMEDGLGHSTVYRTYQTSDGYLWFSTDNGLSRYDGVSFTNYTSQDGLGSNFIFDVTEWKNRLYISSFGGGIIMLDSGTFKPAAPSHAEQPLFPIALTPHQNELWIQDRFKHVFRFKENSFKQLTNQDLKQQEKTFPLVNQVGKAYDGGLYLATTEGLYHFRYNTFTRIEVPGLKPDESVLRFVEVSNKIILIATKERLIEFNIPGQTTTTWLDKEKFGFESSLLKDNEGNIWASSLSGNLYVCKRRAQGAEVIKVSEGTVINQIYQDREQNIWLSTYGEGAWRIQSIHIRNYSIKGCIVSDMLIDRTKNNVIVTTANAGLRFFHQNESRYLTSTTDQKMDRFFKDKQPLAAAVTLPDGTFLFSGDHSLYKWSNKNVDSIKSQKTIAAIYPQLAKNRIWIGGRLALAYTDTLLKTLTTIPGFEKTIVRSIIENKEGKILLGTDAGVMIENEKGFTLLPDENNESLYVNALYYNKETDRVWVGTNSGLGYIENNVVKQVEHPLGKRRCNTIISDNHGNIWAGTVQGLLRVYDDKVELISTREGISQSNIVKLIFQPDNSLLTALTPNSISTIETESLLRGAKFELPDIVVENIYAGNTRYEPTGGPIRVPQSSKDLTIDISTPLIKNRDKLSFTYQINNESRREFNGQKIILHTPPYGALNLKVIVQEEFKPAVTKAIDLSFFIERPFYLKWWFFVLMAALFLGVVAWVVVFYSKRKNVKLVEENKRLDVEHKALRNLLNPHFLYNAINSIHAFVLQNDQRKTLAYLAKFSQLVRLNLELLATDRVALQKELKNLSLYLEFEKLRFADKLNYEIRIDPTLNHSDIQIPSFFIQPFLENAIWHGLLPRSEGGNLLLHIEQQNDDLLITIDDDGVGINASLKKPKTEIDEKTSMGISIIKERIELLNKLNGSYHLSIMDKGDLNGKANGTGTVVKIKVPMT